jgi:hypothetical protein
MDDEDVKYVSGSLKLSTLVIFAGSSFLVTAGRTFSGFTLLGQQTSRPAIRSLAGVLQALGA